MNLKEYENDKIYLYERFSRVVENILQSAIKASGNYRLQQIQCRAKNPNSLRTKLREKKLLRSKEIEEKIHDLAGCRIIFYYDTDLNNFVRSLIIGENFKVINGKDFFHDDSSSNANDQYTAIHYVVKLSDDREHLPEYREYAGLTCEIQIHTILSHAWSETNHEIVYKKKKLNGFGQKLLTSMEERLTMIMKEHIGPAGLEFQKIQYDYHNLSNGITYSSENVLKQIESVTNNNDLHHLLGSYSMYFLPNVDAPCVEIVNVIAIIKKSVYKSRILKTENKYTPFGPIPGEDSYSILAICLGKILPYLFHLTHYEGFDSALPLLVEILQSTTSEKEKEFMRTYFGQIAKYQYNVILSRGLYVQNAMISLLTNFDKKQLKSFQQEALKICTALFEFIANNSASPDTQSVLQKIYCEFAQELSIIRGQAISIIMTLYDLVPESDDKIEILNALRVAMTFPFARSVPDTIQPIILKNILDIVDFYLVLIPNSPHAILSAIEKQLWNCLGNTLTGFIEAPDWNASIKKLSREAAEKIFYFKDQINSNKEFVIYKTLIGNNSIFENEWLNPKIATDTCREREKRLTQYVIGINEENLGFWKERILLLIQSENIQTDYSVTMRFMSSFLYQLAEKRPKFILELLQEQESTISYFLTAILAGLIKSSYREKAFLKIEKWISSGKHLSKIGKSLIGIEIINISLIKKLFKKAQCMQDTETLNNLIKLLIHNPNIDIEVKNLFLSTIKALTILKNTEWVQHCWYDANCINWLSKLNKHESKIILKNLIFSDLRHHSSEEILTFFAKNYPNEVLNLLHAKFELRATAGSIDTYEHYLPLQINKLAEQLAKNPHKTIKTVCNWYNGDAEDFRWKGAQLLYLIFPDCPENFINGLLNFIKSKNPSRFQIVMSILTHYHGQHLLHDVFKAIIKGMPEKGEYQNVLMDMLMDPGITMGEFGMVHAYESKRNQIKNWTEKKESIKVKKFAKKLLEKLKTEIASQRRWAIQRTEMQKHALGTK